ncbi:MAG: hypothetical protein AAF368_05025, partial [Planctomycetota bacterium]
MRLLALAVLACSCQRAQVATTPMELEHNLLDLSRVEVFAPEGAARLRAQVVLTELAARGEFEICLGEPAEGSFEDSHAARLIFGTSDEAEVLRLAEPLEIETEEGERGFKIFGEWFRAPTDALVFTREDPDRPGLPVTVYAANDPLTLHNWMQDFEPCSRPGVRVFAGGELAFSARCSLSGSPWLGTLFDARS